MESSPSQLSAIIVWAPQDSPRLRYVLDWLLNERLGLTYELTHDADRAKAAPHCLSYGWLDGPASIHAGTLLWETGTVQHDISVREWQGLHTLYFDEESPCDIQFDMLSGIFYLLTRYEEYLPFTPDRHNRYPAAASILFPVLDRPVVDEWVEALRLFLVQVWDVSIPAKAFLFLPTYDVDIAWAYQFKGWKRTIGATLKDLAAGHRSRLEQRIRVLQGKEQDPYDSFVFLLARHMMDEVRPLFFFLAARQSSPFDKNIPPDHPRMTALIRSLSGSSGAGLHPSYYSDVKPQRLKEEQTVLERITQQSVTISRQHFIKLRFPETFHALIAAGIRDDYSMGYSTHLGFRAGTGMSFMWYDLSQEQQTSLRVHPFAFMDSTAHYDLGLSAEEAFQQLRALTDRLIAVHSRLITVMHNYSLGTDAEWMGWKGEYERFLNNIRSYQI